jgi:hypothetical protein
MSLSLSIEITDLVSFNQNIHKSTDSKHLVVDETIILKWIDLARDMWLAVVKEVMRAKDFLSLWRTVSF